MDSIPNLTNEELQDYVVYIDEIDSFLKYTHNDQLTHDIRHIVADSCNTVTQFGAELKRRFPDKVQDIVLVTAQTKVQVQNA